MIFIGYNYDGYVISIISAKTKESANAYWQGKEILPHTIKEFNLNEDRSNEELGFITPLLNTREVDGYEINQMSRDRKFLLVSKS